MSESCGPFPGKSLVTFRIIFSLFLFAIIFSKVSKSLLLTAEYSYFDNILYSCTILSRFNQRWRAMNNDEERWREFLWRVKSKKSTYN